MLHLGPFPPYHEILNITFIADATQPAYTVRCNVGDVCLAYIREREREIKILRDRDL